MTFLCLRDAGRQLGIASLSSSLELLPDVMSEAIEAAAELGL